MAQVYGSDNYEISVDTNRTRIKDWACNCPYDQGVICKHVIATFHAIKEEMDLKGKSTSETQRKSKAESKEKSRRAPRGKSQRKCSWKYEI